MGSVFICIGLGWAIGMGIWAYCEVYRTTTKELGS